VRTEAIHNAAQLTVVHVHDALPGDALRVDPQRISLIDMIVQQGGQQVVRRPDSVKIAGEMQVDVLHWHNLGISAAGGTSLDAEDRAQGWLAQRDDRLFAKAAQPVGKADACGGLSLSGGGRSDGGHENQLSVRAVRQIAENFIIHLRLIAAVQLQILLIHARSFCDFPDVFFFVLLCNFNIG